MEYVPVEEVSLRDVPLNAGDDDGDAVNGGADSLLVVSKDDVALSQQVKETALQEAEGCGQGWVAFNLVIPLSAKITKWANWPTS